MALDLAWLWAKKIEELDSLIAELESFRRDNPDDPHDLATQLNIASLRNIRAMYEDLPQ